MKKKYIKKSGRKKSSEEGKEGNDFKSSHIIDDTLLSKSIRCKRGEELCSPAQTKSSPQPAKGIIDIILGKV